MSKNNIGKWYRKKPLIKPSNSPIEKIFFKNLKLIGYRYFSLENRSPNDQKIIKSFNSIICLIMLQERLTKKPLKLANY